MPQLMLNVPAANGSKLTACLSGITLAAARGFYGVRCSAGMSNMPFSDLTIDVSGITSAVNAASDANLSKISFLLNLGVKRNQAIADAWNAGTLWPVPNLPWTGVTSSMRNRICDEIIQLIVDTARAAAIAKGETPTTFLEFELLNEPGKDGNQEPVDSDGTFTTYPGLSNGQIHADYASMLDLVLTRVNFQSIPTISVTLEASGTTEATTEVNSISGATWTSVIGACTRIGFNRYADTISPPYVEADVKSAFSTKVQAQVTRMVANAVIGSKAKSIREFGINSGLGDGTGNRTPPCTHCNQIKSDLCEAMAVEANIQEAGLYTAYNVGSSSSSGDYAFYCYEPDNTPRIMFGSAVHITLP